jgi:hypothetical protein
VEILTLAAAADISEYGAEQQVLGVTHAELGAYLLGLWGLPYAIVEATAYHHLPEPPGDPDSWDIPSGVWLAEFLYREDVSANLPPALASRPAISNNYARWLQIARGMESAA